MVSKHFLRGNEWSHCFIGAASIVIDFINSNKRGNRFYSFSSRFWIVFFSFSFVTFSSCSVSVCALWWSNRNQMHTPKVCSIIKFAYFSLCLPNRKKSQLFRWVLEARVEMESIWNFFLRFFLFLLFSAILFKLIFFSFARIA